MKICPRCKKMNLREKNSTNAFSRRANIYICSSCGTEEALVDWMRKTSSRMPPEILERETDFLELAKKLNRVRKPRKWERKRR